MPVQTALGYLRRNWQIIAIVILVLGAGVSLSGQFVLSAQQSDAQAEQFCTAIPNVAAAGAKALVNVAIANAETPPTKAELKRMRRIGRELAAEARRLALADLPDCPQPTKEP